MAEGNGLQNRCMATLSDIAFSKFFSALQAVLNLQTWFAVSVFVFPARILLRAIPPG